MGRNEKSLCQSHKSWQYFLVIGGKRKMVFVTVGTHEQPFDRLIKYIDELKGNDEIMEEVIIQTGFSTYEPKYCICKKLFSYQEMIKKIKDARIIITHGGPSSFLMPLQIGKIPIVVPRQKQFGEHVNNHQVDFARAVSKRQGMIIVVEDISELKDTLLNYDKLILKKSVGMVTNNQRFNTELKKIIEDMF